MNASEYQKQAARTLLAEPDNKYGPTEIMLVWNALGLAGEAGEVADIVKKVVFHRHDYNREKLVDELGDVMWYVAAICSTMNIPLSEVLDRNVAKLRQRYEKSYNSEESKLRRDIYGG